MEAETISLQKELDAGKDATAKRWHRLARYYEAARQLPEATIAIKKTLALDEKWIPGWATAARVYEAEGNLLAAADANRKLAAIDRRYRTEYLTNVAKLESRLGRREQALAAGRDLLASAPGNPETYKFYALIYGNSITITGPDGRPMTEGPLKSLELRVYYYYDGTYTKENVPDDYLRNKKPELKAKVNCIM